MPGSIGLSCAGEKKGFNNSIKGVEGRAEPSCAKCWLAVCPRGVWGARANDGNENAFGDIGAQERSALLLLLVAWPKAEALTFAALWGC